MKNTKLEDMNSIELYRRTIIPLKSTDHPAFFDTLHRTDLNYKEESQSLSPYLIKQEEECAEANLDFFQTLKNSSLNINSPLIISKPSLSEELQNEYFWKEKKEMRVLKTKIQNLSLTVIKKDQTKKIVNIHKEKNSPTKCNCRKSSCLKFYCDCLASGKYCDKKCSCHDCKNNSENVEIISDPLSTFSQPLCYSQGKRILNIKEKNRIGGVDQGCHCQKSKCEKKYCECFARGVNCSSKCSCMNCNNKILRHQENHEKLRKVRKLNSGKEVQAHEDASVKERRQSSIQKINGLNEKTLSIVAESGNMNLTFFNPKKCV